MSERRMLAALGIFQLQLRFCVSFSYVRIDKTPFFLSPSRLSPTQASGDPFYSSTFIYIVYNWAQGNVCPKG